MMSIPFRYSAALGKTNRVLRRSPDAKGGAGRYLRLVSDDAIDAVVYPPLFAGF
jgi:hypothetical protein